MSAFFLDSPPTMPTMVSRLPKFGLHTKSASASSGSPTGEAAVTNTCTSTASTSTRLTNGFYHHSTQAGVNRSLTADPVSVKQNGFIRVPTSFSMKWGKENETSEDGGAGRETELRSGNGGKLRQNRSVNNVHQYYSQQQQGSPVAAHHDFIKPTASSAGKGRGSSDQTVTSSSSPSPQASPKTLPASKSGSQSSKPSHTASGLSSSTKQPLNGLPVSNLRRPQNFARLSSSRPGSGPGSLSGSPLKKKQQANRSHSSDSVGSAPPNRLTECDRLRSRSLTQVRQQSSPTPNASSTSSSLSSNRTVTHSFSSSRAAGQAPKQLMAPSTQAPPRGKVAKSPFISKTPEVGGRGGGVKAQSSAVPGRSGIKIPSVLPPSALRKPLLPSLCPASNHSGISYKLSRPSLNKQSRPLRAAPANVSKGASGEQQGLMARSNSVETPSTTENSPEMTPVTPETEGLMAEAVSQSEVSIVGETLEDMSLSSNSSLNKNDGSQEYMDDFDNLGNGGAAILLLSSKNDEDDSGLNQSCARFDDKLAVNGVTEAEGLRFLDDGMDWASMRLNGERGEPQLTSLPHRRRFSQPDYHEQGGSSLDLSPSDSCGSGGTYMWDEEGLEPLGGAATSASINSNTSPRIGSFASDVSSIDILNNLESCDLDDDDLMLDEDFIEDASLHSDGNGISHMAQWRKRQLCWGTQDVHIHNESDIQCYKLTEDAENTKTDRTRNSDLILQLCPPRSPCLSPATTGMDLDVEELAEDYSAVRSQLEYLQRLLLQEEDVDDDTLTTDTLSPEATDSSRSSDTQVQTLLQEVQRLREELRSRDKTIAQLTLQLAVPPVTTRCCCKETTRGMDRHTQTSVAERESVACQTPWRETASQILHSSCQAPLTGRCPAPSPSQAPPLANHRATQAHIPTVSTLDCPDPTEGGKHSVKRLGRREEKGETKESRGSCTRSLQPPQPSKLRLFLSQPSSSVSTSAAAAATAPKTRLATQLPHGPQSNGTSGVKLKMASGSSRLPKPKSH